MIDRRRLMALLGAAPFARAARAQASDQKIKVVATFSILADLVQQVGGDRIDVTSLVGPNGDAHVYQPSPADARKVAEAKLVVMNGLGLEGWFERFVAASGARPRLVIATQGVRPLKGDGKGADDPHAWQDVGNAQLYVRAIRDALADVDPDGKAAYEAKAAAYLDALAALDTDVRAAMAAIPAARRRIITTHDAFGYFGRAYGMTFLAPEGVSTESEPTARDVARIIRQIRTEAIPAVFLENVSDRRMMEQIARESGAKIGGTLYSDALSAPSGPAGTYIDMMRNNIREFTAALKP